jgi:Contractile injection system tube protein
MPDNSPRLLKGGIVQVDPDSGNVLKVIPLQYNPETLSRTLQVKSVPTASEGGDRSEALRLKGPPVETIRLDAEIDATDALEKADSTAAASGIHAQLAALEMITYPSSDQLIANNAQQQSGTLEIIPMQAPLVLFVWGKNRVLPVRISDLNITEEAFDENLNPVRAKVSLSMRVLSVDDLGFSSKGGSIFMAYQQLREGLAKKSPTATLNTLGLGGIP